MSSFSKAGPVKKTNILLLFLLLLFLSCRFGSNQEVDLQNIELIENEGYNILKRMEHYKVPGVSIAFLNEGEIVWAKGYGYTSADSSKAVDDLTLFQAASISKPVAALAALFIMLVPGRACSWPRK